MDAMTSTSHRIALVTGASSGIGKSVVDRLSSSCAGIVLHARSARDKLEAVAEGLSTKGVESEILTGDLADRGVGSDIVAAARSKFGRLDVLVANAGFPTPIPFNEGSLEDIEYALRGNLVSFFELARAAHEMLCLAPAPRIVAVGSFTSFLFRTDLNQFPISAASKGGLVTAVRSVAAAVAKDGITVNCVVPGYIERESRPGHPPPANSPAEIAERVPLGRMGKPHEVAAMIDFLASEEASYITGQAIHVNGGLL